MGGQQLSWPPIAGEQPRAAVSRLTVNAVKDFNGGASLGASLDSEIGKRELRPVWDKVAS